MGILGKQSVVAVAVFLSTFAQAQWSQTERRALTETLRIGNLVEADLEWDRQPNVDAFRLPVIAQSLARPVQASDDWLRRCDSWSASSIGKLLREIGSLSPGEEPTVATPKLSEVGKWDGPEQLKEPVVKLTGQIAMASLEIKQILAPLSEEDRRKLIESLPSLMAEEFTPALDFVKQKPMTQAAAFELIQKVEHERLFRIAGFLADAVDEATLALRPLKLNLVKPLDLRLYGRTVRIYGTGDDTHTETDASLTIDLGGNDRYVGRHGAGIGYASVLIDLGGDDVYEPKDLSIGSGVLGIGISRDEGGDDTYRTRSLSLGFGLLGVGVHADASGNDHYDSPVLSQGFGAFGAGVLIDAKGSDSYDIDLYGQGAGRTQGYGVLVDREGRDIYRAGGTALNSPLFADVHYSFAQGFGMGFREDTGGVSGGVGLLLDGAGDDAYLAETYAQGASYWYSLGVLWDRAGHDTYSAYHYAQSSAMHCTSAFLFDLKGDDAYSLKFGAGHAIGHDYGVAVLLDREGNDVFAARDSNPGVGNANGLAIFVDAAGDDRYAGPPGRGNAARGSGSFGLFVDITGQDRYREGLADSSAAVTNSWGIAYDLETPRVGGSVAAQAPPRPEPGSIAAPSDTELAELYRRATQWGVGTAQADVEVAVGRLIGIGLPAVQWMLDQRLARADRLQIRGFTAIINGVGTPARNALAAKVATGNLDEKRIGLSIAVDGRMSELGPLVPTLIGQPALRLQAIRAAGALASKESVAELMPLTRTTGNIGLAAMVSLAQIGDEGSYATGEAMLTSANLPLRRAAMALVAKFPLRGIDSATRLLAESDERKARIGIELLGAIGTPDALNLIAERLLDPSPGIRMQTLIELNGRCPEDKRLTLIALRSDPDPAVRAVAMRIDPGR